MVFLVFWDSIPKRCKGVHCVDLGESFPTRIYLQNRRRYSRERAPRSLRGKFNSIFTSLLRHYSPAISTSCSGHPFTPSTFLSSEVQFSIFLHSSNENSFFLRSNAANSATNSKRQPAHKVPLQSASHASKIPTFVLQ